MQQDNNGPIVSCPLCNDDGSHLPKCEEEVKSTIALNALPESEGK